MVLASSTKLKQEMTKKHEESGTQKNPKEEPNKERERMTKTTWRTLRA
jgi:hypothetical protein